MEGLPIPRHDARRELDSVLKEAFAGSSDRSKLRRNLLNTLFELWPKSDSGQLLSAKEVATRLGPESIEISDVDVRQAMKDIRNLLARYYNTHEDTRFQISLPIGRGYRLDIKWRVIYSTEHSASVFRSEKVDEQSLKRALTIAIDALNSYTSAGFEATITNCADLLRQGSTAEACSALALAYINLGATPFCHARWSLSVHHAREVIKSALELFPYSETAHALKALLHMIYDYDWNSADEELSKIPDRPLHAITHSVLAQRNIIQGSLDKALDHARISTKLDFQNPVNAMMEPWILLFSGKIEEAVACGETLVERFGHRSPVRTVLGDAYAAAGDLRKALNQYDYAQTNIECSPVVVSGRAFILGRMGKRNQALAALKELHQRKTAGILAYVSSWHEAIVYVGLKEVGRALDALERAFEERCDWLIHLGVDPHWDTLRGDERFRQLLRRMRITERPRS